MQTTAGSAPGWVSAPGGVPGRRHPPSRTREQTPPGSRYLPCAVHAGRYGQQAGGTHPTSMHTCCDWILYSTTWLTPSVWLGYFFNTTSFVYCVSFQKNPNFKSLQLFTLLKLHFVSTWMKDFPLKRLFKRKMSCYLFETLLTNAAFLLETYYLFSQKRKKIQ